MTTADYVKKEVKMQEKTKNITSEQFLAVNLLKSIETFLIV